MLRVLPFLGALVWTAVPSGALTAAPAFAAVVHQSNPMNNLRLADLRAFFSGSAKRWPQGMKVVLVERDTAGDASRFLFDRILNTTPRDYKRHLANIEFMGAEPITLKILNSDAAACKFVFNVPGAIALIEAGSLESPECGQVQILRIDGKLPPDRGYALR
jgi:hypothetical protein